jgi:hypothetical protein
MTKKQRRKKNKPEFYVDLFQKTVAYNLRPSAETAMSHQLMLALANKLAQYDYKPVEIAKVIINKKNQRVQAYKNTQAAMALVA